MRKKLPFGSTYTEKKRQRAYLVPFDVNRPFVDISTIEKNLGYFFEGFKIEQEIAHRSVQRESEAYSVRSYREQRPMKTFTTMSCMSKGL